MNTDKPHITEYKVYAYVLIALLVLTSISVWITHLTLKAWTVGVALVVTCVMAFLVLVYFMHLKFDSMLIKILVTLIFLLLTIVIGITLIDYKFTY